MAWGKKSDHPKTSQTNRTHNRLECWASPRCADFESGGIVMSSSHLIKLGKINGGNGILVALKHNKRTLQSEHGAPANIDVARSSLNYSLVNEDTPEQIAKHAKGQMIVAGIERPRKNCVRAVEILFSLPTNRHQQDTRRFFMDCYEWVKQTFAGELLSFDVHLDESAPHAHAVILPLIDGKMQGSKLVGGTGNLMRLINEFHKSVARHHGLSRSDKKRLSNADKETIEKHVLKYLSNDPVMESSVWPCIRDLIHNDPLPFAEMLGIELAGEVTKSRSFVDIKRSKGKGTFIH